MNMWRLSFKLKAAFEQEKLTKPAKAPREVKKGMGKG